MFNFVPYETRYRVFWTLCLMVGAALFLTACSTPAQTAGVGAGIAATFDGILQTLVASKQLDPAAAAGMSGALHQTVDSATQTATDVKTLWDQVRDMKEHFTQVIHDGVVATQQGFANTEKMIPSHAQIVAEGGTGGALGGTALTHLIRGPSTPPHVKAMLPARA